jgi:hypothetical protein
LQGPQARGTAQHEAVIVNEEHEPTQGIRYQDQAQRRAEIEQRRRDIEAEHDGTDRAQAQATLFRRLIDDQLTRLDENRDHHGSLFLRHWANAYGYYIPTKQVTYHTYSPRAYETAQPVYRYASPDGYVFVVEPDTSTSGTRFWCRLEVYDSDAEGHRLGDLCQCKDTDNRDHEIAPVLAMRIDLADGEARVQLAKQITAMVPHGWGLDPIAIADYCSSEMRDDGATVVAVVTGQLDRLVEERWVSLLDEMVEDLADEPTANNTNRATPFLRGSSGAKMPYPLDVIPEPARSSIEQTAAALGVAPGLVALPTLVMIGTAMGRRVHLALKAGYSLTPLLWAANVAPPGSVKSAAQGAALAPLYTLQREADEAYNTEYAKWKEAERQAKKDAPPFAGKPPVREHFVTTNATMEALMEVLQSPGVVYIGDELFSIFNQMNQYRSGKGGDRETFMTLWNSGATFKVDRKTVVGTSLYDPALSIMGGLQPARLHEFAPNVVTADGFLERFIWEFDEGAPPLWSDATVDSSITAAMTEVAKKLRYEVRPCTVNFSDEALTCFTDWYDDNAREAARHHGLMRGALAKYPVHVARLALILHAVQHYQEKDWATPVSVETIDAAITLGAYYQQQMRLVFNGIDKNIPVLPGLTELEGKLLFASTKEYHPTSWYRFTAMTSHVPAELQNAAFDRLVQKELLEHRSATGNGRTADEYRLGKKA